MTVSVCVRLIWSSKLAVRQQHLTKSTCTLYQFRLYVVYVVCGKGFVIFFISFGCYCCCVRFFLYLVSKRRFNMLSYVASVMQIWITYMLCIMKSPVVGCFCIVICWCDTRRSGWEMEGKRSRVNRRFMCARAQKYYLSLRGGYVSSSQLLPLLLLFSSFIRLIMCVCVSLLSAVVKYAFDSLT